MDGKWSAPALGGFNCFWIKLDPWSQSYSGKNCVESDNFLAWDSMVTCISDEAMYVSDSKVNSTCSYWTRSQVSRTSYHLLSRSSLKSNCGKEGCLDLQVNISSQSRCKLNQLTFVTIKENSMEIKSIKTWNWTWHWNWKKLIMKWMRLKLDNTEMYRDHHKGKTREAKVS